MTCEVYYKVTFFTLKNIIKLSRGEFCVANFIPPANGASLGSPKTGPFNFLGGLNWLAFNLIGEHFWFLGPLPRTNRTPAEKKIGI